MAEDPTSSGDDDMSAWAEALEEAKSAPPRSDGGTENNGGPLFGGEPVMSASATADAAMGDINRVLDIPVQLSVELGRVKVPIKYILQLAQGSVVELDALAGEPMDVLVNGYLIAQGEVVVVNDKFGIRLTDVVTPSERLRRVSKG